MTNRSTSDSECCERIPRRRTFPFTPARVVLLCFGLKQSKQTVTSKVTLRHSRSATLCDSHAQTDTLPSAADTGSYRGRDLLSTQKHRPLCPDEHPNSEPFFPNRSSTERDNSALDKVHRTIHGLWFYLPQNRKVLLFLLQNHHPGCTQHLFTAWRVFCPAGDSSF